MVAGPNGSGKSTLIAAIRADPRFALPALYINADDLQREQDIRDARDAQHLATDLRIRALAKRQDVMYETVMSHPSKIGELQAAKNAGYHITVLLVATGDPNINVQRVAVRVAAGGHDVPEDRTRSRYIRTLALAPVAIGYADQAFVFDNTHSGEAGGGLNQQAGLAGDRLAITGHTTASWVTLLIEQVSERVVEMSALTKHARSSGLLPQLAGLQDSQTAGPLIEVGKHYVMQYDELSNTSVLHDRALLGSMAARFVAGLVVDIRYHEGVASERAQ